MTDVFSDKIGVKESFYIDYAKIFEDIYSPKYSFYSPRIDEPTFIFSKIIPKKYLNNFFCFLELFFGYSRTYSLDYSKLGFYKDFYARNITDLIDFAQNHSIFDFISKSFFSYGNIWIDDPVFRFVILSNQKVHVFFAPLFSYHEHQYKMLLRFCRLVGDCTLYTNDSFFYDNLDFTHLTFYKHFPINSAFSLSHIKFSFYHWKEHFTFAEYFTSMLDLDEPALIYPMSTLSQIYVDYLCHFVSKYSYSYIRKVYLTGMYLQWLCSNFVAHTVSSCNPRSFLNYLCHETFVYNPHSDGFHPVFYYIPLDSDLLYLQRLHNILYFNYDYSKDYISDFSRKYFYSTLLD